MKVLGLVLPMLAHEEDTGAGLHGDGEEDRDAVG